MPSLGNDLATLRKKKDLSIENVRKNTRIPVHILESIEDDSIFDNMQNNVTYTRSYVRSYAKSIGVKEADIVTALDKVEQDNYDGSLLSEAERTEETEPKPENDPKPEANQKAEDASVVDSNLAEEQNEKKSEEKNAKKKATPVSSTGIRKDSDNWDWVRVGQRATTKNSQSKRTGILLIILVIAIIAAGYFAYSYYNEGETETNSSEPVNNEMQQPATPSDSLRETLLNNDGQTNIAENQPSESGGVLADTLVIAIYAADGELEPVRVYTDILGKRNPYWVTQGDTIRFNFVNTIRLRAADQYDRMQLLFNGHVIQNYYQDFYNSGSGMVELNRADFENHTEWHQPAE